MNDKTTDHKPKKLTKTQREEQFKLAVANDYQSKVDELDSNKIKFIMCGYESANQMILDYMDNHTFDEVKEFIKKNLKQENIDLMKKVVDK